MPRPRISIVTPSYNQARFLEQAIRSVLDQGYPDLEYIVMDGGSTDGSADIIRRFAPHLAHWQSARDGGQGPAILDGWKRATGDLIAWLNSDDVLLDGSLDAIANAWRPDRHVFFGDLLLFGDEGGVQNYLVQATAPPWVFRGGVMFLGQPGSFLSRQLAEQVGFFDPALVCSMEYDLLMRMFAAGARARYVPAPIAALRIYADTKSNMLHEKMRNEQREIFARWAPWPFSIWPVRRAAQKAGRALALTRYASPRRWPGTRTKLRIRRGGVRIDEFLPRPRTPQTVNSP
jgi:glycosyltransferase involved in cell wall biosynthesis